METISLIILISTFLGLIFWLLRLVFMVLLLLVLLLVVLLLLLGQAVDEGLDLDEVQPGDSRQLPLGDARRLVAEDLDALTQMLMHFLQT